MSELAVLVGLFAAAFGAATVLPLQSEAVFVVLLLTGKYPVALLLAVASVGNVAGSVFNWVIGRAIERFRTRRWFPVSAAALDRAEKWYHHYGKWSLLLSWVPIIGDPLTIIAGVLRERLLIFLLFVSIAKTARYAVLAAFSLHWI